MNPSKEKSCYDITHVVIDPNGRKCLKKKGDNMKKEWKSEGFAESSNEIKA